MNRWAIFRKSLTGLQGSREEFSSLTIFIAKFALSSFYSAGDPLQAINMKERDFLSELRTLAGQFTASACPKDKDWQATEAELGIKLPQDFKDFISFFGTGCFGTEIFFTNPLGKESSKLDKVSLEDYMASSSIRMDLIQKGFWRRLFPEKRDGLFIVAGTGVGVHLFLDLKSGCIVAIDYNDDRIYETRMVVAEFFRKLYGDFEWTDESIVYLKECAWPEETTRFFTPLPS